MKLRLIIAAIFCLSVFQNFAQEKSKIKFGKVTADDIVTKMKKNSDLPIILMSAIHNLKEVATKLKVDDYIEKPFHIDVFKTKINNLIHDFHNNNN